jgi:hypothetical protein
LKTAHEQPNYELLNDDFPSSTKLLRIYSTLSFGD